MTSTRRSSMEHIIGRVRALTGDTSTSQQFLDEQIQDVCDEHRDDVNYLELAPQETISVAGVSQWFTFHAPYGAWEADVTLVQPGATYVTLTPSTSDLLIGRWTLAASTTPPVLVRGQVYDVHAAAADLLDMWATALASNAMDFGSGTKRFARSKLVDQLERRAAAERCKARIGTVKITRSDMAGGRDYQGDDQRWRYRRVV